MHLLFQHSPPENVSKMFTEKYHMLPKWLSGKEFACNEGGAGDVGLIPGLGRSPGGGNGNLPQYSCLENPWTEEPGRLQTIGSQRINMTEAT